MMGMASYFFGSMSSMAQNGNLTELTSGLGLGNLTNSDQFGDLGGMLSSMTSQLGDSHLLDNIPGINETAY